MATDTKTTKSAAKPVAAKKPAAVKKAPKITSDEFAVIKTGGKQYRVSVGDTITIEKFKEASTKGDAVSFDEVLLMDNGTQTTVGTPMISGAAVKGEVVLVGRAQKVTVIKYKQKSRYMKKNGHRQPFIKVKINSIA